MNPVRVVSFSNKEEYETDRAALLTLLKTVRIPPITKNRLDLSGNVVIPERENVIGPIGRTCNFGLTRSRRTGYCLSRYSTKYPEVYRAIFKFANHVCPAGMDVTSITLNYGVKAKKHVDSFNVGDSVIVGIGDYTDGKLRVYDGGKTSETFTAYNIHDTPLMFNGALLAHETEDFTGERYTIIFYSQRPKVKPWTCDIVVNGTGVI